VYYLEAKVEPSNPRWTLEPGREYVIGRHEECDVVLDDASVSRRHVGLVIRDGAVELSDLGSTNGVWVYGKRVVEQEIPVDQWFAVGTVLMIVREGITFGPDSDAEPVREGLTPPDVDETGRGKRSSTLVPGDGDAGGTAPAREITDLLEQADTVDDLRNQLLSWTMNAYELETVAILLRHRTGWVVEAGTGSRLNEEIGPRLSEGGAGDRRVRVPLAGGEALCVPLHPLSSRPAWLVLVGRPAAPRFDPGISLVAGLIALSRRPIAGEREPAPAPITEDAGGLARGERDPLLVVSETMRSLVRQVDRLARSDLPVFLHGESGTGKELLARRLHERSPRSGGPFVIINCAALPHDLLEAELFGIETGVATGVTARPGKFSLASGGTLFLDEVGDLPDVLQPKLLRALESGEIAPLGAPSAVPVDVRIVAASHQDLEEKSRRGEYRRDLLYRLAGAIVRVPPLRERPEEVLPLARHFAVELSRSRGVPFEGLSMAAAQALLGYSWPGNVRELRHAVARAVALTDGPILGPEVLPPEVDATSDETQGRVMLGLSKEFKSARRDFERLYLSALVERCGGNMTEASRLAGMSRSSLYRKLDELGLRGQDEA
jgi:DNA-binding NtrC family response regulator/pSer/pThr/pTyr-binding forkhead associated (FHA) protein